MSHIWGNGQPLVVTTRGAGSVHLLTYNTNGLGTPCIGAIPTTNTGVTRFLVSFSHSFLSYAFFWDGPGEAVYTIGAGLQRHPVGKSWTQASVTTFGDSNVTTADVSQYTVGPHVANVGQTTPCYIIPDKT